MGTQRWQGWRAAGGPNPPLPSASGTGFLEKAYKQEPSAEMGWDHVGPCFPAAQVTARLAPGARGTAEPRGATLPVPTAAQWPSPLPWGPAWHGTVYCTTKGTMSRGRLCPWEHTFEPKVRPRQAEVPESVSPCSGAGHRPCDRIWPMFPQGQRGLLTHSSRTAPQWAPMGTPAGHTRSPWDPPLFWVSHSSQHTAPTTSLPGSTPFQARKRLGEGTAAQEGPWGTGPGGQDSGEVEVSPSALFYQP